MLSKVALTLNLLALLPALLGTGLLGFLANVLISSIHSSDKLAGWIFLAVGIPLFLSGPAIGLWLLFKPGWPPGPMVSSILGGLWLLLGIGSVFLLPSMLEAAVRP